MMRYLMLLVILSLDAAGDEVCKATSSCKKKMVESYLDIAVDMIGKAVLNFPTSVGVDCEANRSNNHTRGALDCSELLLRGYHKSGVYNIWPANRITADKSVEVYCDMQTDGGGWTLIQRRGQFQNPSDYFFKEWKSYKEGFGEVEKEFWLGNDNIFALSNQNLYSVRFDLRDMENNTRYALYDTFWIDDESRQYTLHIAGYTGDAGDSMKDHNDHKFTTKDKDNDIKTSDNCAQQYKGGWWYLNCHYVNLNGLNLRGKYKSVGDGVTWHSWKGDKESMESTEIKIRPKNFGQNYLSLNTPM